MLKLHVPLRTVPPLLDLPHQALYCFPYKLLSAALWKAMWCPVTLAVPRAHIYWLLHPVGIPSFSDPGISCVTFFAQ